MGPNEVDVKDLSSFPNASEKDAAAPAIQKYAEPPKPQVQHPLPHWQHANARTAQNNIHNRS